MPNVQEKGSRLKILKMELNILKIKFENEYEVSELTQVYILCLGSYSSCQNNKIR